MHLFLVYAPDHSDAESMKRRLASREQHLANLAKPLEDGMTRKAGGAMLAPESITGGEFKMLGSVFFIQAETIEGVRKVVEEDVFYTSGVWDKEKIVITPFMAAKGFD